MLGDQERSGLKDEHAQVGVAIDLLGAIGAEHAGSDDYDVRLDTAVLHRFGPSAADESSGNVVRKRGVLDRRKVVGFLQTSEHGCPLSQWLVCILLWDLGMPAYADRRSALPAAGRHLKEQKDEGQRKEVIC